MEFFKNLFRFTFRIEFSDEKITKEKIEKYWNRHIWIKRTDLITHRNGVIK